jgi:hypothetical protein
MAMAGQMSQKPNKQARLIALDGFTPKTYYIRSRTVKFAGSTSAPKSEDVYLRLFCSPNGDAVSSV